MKLISLKELVCLCVFSMALAACAPGGLQASSVTLPDDPTSEEPANGNTGQATTPPSDSPSDGSGDTGTTGGTPLMTKYSYVDPTKIVPAGQLQTALQYYDANLTKIKNKDYLSVIDFSQFSGKKRFYVINMKTGEVWALRVAHGKGSDPDHDGYANSFSNVSGSNASSLGFYMTSDTYEGSHGYSLLLDGLSATNSNVRSRAIVIHGADYVTEANVTQGRSWGCPAVAMENRTKLINMIRNGSIIYASATER